MGWAAPAFGRRPRYAKEGRPSGLGVAKREGAQVGPVYGGCEPGRQAEGERQVVERAAPLGEKR